MHPKKIGRWVLEKTGGDGSCLVGLETASNFLFMKRACASSSFKYEGFFYFGVRNQRESFWWKWTVVKIVQIKTQEKNVATSKHAIFPSSLSFLLRVLTLTCKLDWIWIWAGEIRDYFPVCGKLSKWSARTKRCSAFDASNPFKMCVSLLPNFTLIEQKALIQLAMEANHFVRHQLKTFRDWHLGINVDKTSPEKSSWFIS